MLILRHCVERMKVVHNTMLKQAAVKRDDIQEMVAKLEEVQR